MKTLTETQIREACLPGSSERGQITSAQPELSLDEIIAEIETCFPHAKKLVLEVVVGNEDALAFYQAHGMKEAGGTEDCGACGSGVPAIVLEKDLPGG